MKNNELVFRHKISNNKVVFYLMACAFAIIISLGVSAKCSAAVSDLEYIYNHTDFEQGKSEYYYKKYNYEDIQYVNPDSKKNRYTHIPESCVYYKGNEFGEYVHMHHFNMYYGDQYRQPVVIITFCANVINNETTNCEIWINGEFEDTVKLGRNTLTMIGKLPIERFSKAGDYTIEVIAEGIDGKKMVASMLIRVSRPYIPPETSLINKIENTSNNTGLKVEWDDLGAVNSYYVYRAKEKDGFYKLMGITYEPYLIDEDVEAGQKYCYRVVANFSNDEKFQSADVEGSLKPIESLATDNNGQTIKKSKTTSDRNTKLNKPKISIKKKRRNWQIYWGIISDKSTGIDVYMKNGYGKYKKYRKINTTTKLKKSKNKKGAVGITSSNKSLIKGVKYKFKARTFYYKTNGRKVYSKWSNVIKLKG